MVKALNTLSGLVVDVPEKVLRHPVLGQNFVVAEDTQKSYIKEMYEPKSADEFTEVKSKRSKKTDNETDEVAVEVVELDEQVTESFEDTEDE